MIRIQNAVISIAACLSLVGGPAVLAADVDTMGKLDARAVNKMRVIKDADVYYLEVEVTFQNKNPDAFKLRRASFYASLETNDDAISTNQAPRTITFAIGKAALDELEIPGATPGNAAGTKVEMIRFQLGPNNEETRARLVQLINVLGDPAAPMVLQLQGEAEVGLKHPNGWVFARNGGYEVDLRFVPTIQRRALFQ